MEDTAPYRVLATEIPLTLSCEEFYDYLRAHTGDRGLYNALLLTPQQTGNEDHSNSSTVDFSRPSLSPVKNIAKDNRRNIGAAYVDFVSKSYAEAAMRIPFSIGTTLVKWRTIGRVYETSSYRPSSSPSTPGFQDRFRHAAQRGRIAYLSCKRRVEIVDLNGEKKRRKTEQELFNSDSSNMSSVFISALQSKNQNHSDVLKYCENIPTEHLFCLIQTALQQLHLGFLHSIERIAADEIILFTDADTARALEEQMVLRFSLTHPILPTDQGLILKQTTPPSRFITWTVSPSSLKKKTIAEMLLLSSTQPLQTAAPTPIIRTNSTSSSAPNLSLARKEEVVRTIARLFESSHGKTIGFKDKYGNYYFPFTPSSPPL